MCYYCIIYCAAIVNLLVSIFVMANDSIIPDSVDAPKDLISEVPPRRLRSGVVRPTEDQAHFATLRSHVSLLVLTLCPSQVGSAAPMASRTT